MSHGVHRVIHDSPIVPFAIFLYGYARADSYGYPGGLRLADLTLECVPGKPGDGLDNDCDRRIDEEIKNYIDDDDDGMYGDILIYRSQFNLFYPHSTFFILILVDTEEIGLP